ncbi:MAG TPA: PAS domain-containing sensor histidine kinase [Desulfomonilaceae bacterium]|nr:PAS domain-containing sensor histidine kinase [Desulfomonilaceae bacterium]
MLRSLFKQLEKRVPIETALAKHSDLFRRDSANQIRFSESGFSSLIEFVEKGDASFQGLAVQAGVRWSTSSQKVMLRNALLNRGFLTPSCLWAYRQLRGAADELFREVPSPEMEFMRIVLMKEADPSQSVPFLMEKFLTRRDVPEELRAASRLCILRLLDAGVSPELIRYFQCRYPGVQILKQWRPAIPGKKLTMDKGGSHNSIDFHQLVRSIHDLKELSSLTRTVYLMSLFYVPLTDKEWQSLWLSRTDHLFFHRLRLAGIVVEGDSGYLMSTDSNKQNIVKKFLYESYPLVRETVHRNRTERLREDRERRVRNSELDRLALEMIPDGIVCIDRSGLLYYMNPAAESTLGENKELRELLFGSVSLETALRKYSRETVVSRITANMKKNGVDAEIFGDRILMTAGGKRFEVELGPQVILLRDITDQYVIDTEIGKLYRHEFKAALDVLGVGLDSAKELLKRGLLEESAECLGQIEEKRMELFSLLEEKMDFIRLHSDAFQIRPTQLNLNLVVDKCLSNYLTSAAAKKIEVESDHLHVAAVHVLGEERFLLRALDNLVRNAVKFSDRGSKIWICIGSEDGEAFVRVEDSGPGIPRENIGKIFQLGFTTGGTGRGLYLARRIAVAHSGRIEVKSSPGSGSRFTFRMPLSNE